MSESLMVIWQIAELHARKLQAEKIEPHHLLLALAKCVDLDLTALVPKSTPKHDEILEQLLREVRRVRTVFQKGGLNAKVYRRKLRNEVTQITVSLRGPATLHRSALTKKFFHEAQHYAELSEQVVYPVHLLLAVLLAKVKSSDDLLRELGVDKTQLLKIARDEVFNHGQTKLAHGHN